MASLFNTRISDTYSGLIKTIDNAALTASLKELTDGSGLSSGLYMNNAGDFKVTAILEFGSLKDTGENIIISKFVDAADGIGNNDNDTTIPTTAAIIDYVAAQITIEDLDFTGDTGSGQIDLDSQIFAIGGTTNEITTVASGQSITFSLDSTGVYLPDNSTAITQTAGDNSTKIATTSYVDTLDAASDLDFSGDSGTGDVNLNTQTFAITGTTNQIESSASNQGLSLQFPSAGVTLPNGSVATTQSSSDDSTKVATTAYVKGLNNASDLDFITDSGSGAVVLNSETLSVVGTTNEIETSGSGQEIQIGLPSSISTNLVGNVTGNLTGNVVGDLTGNADTATAWETARDLSLTGQATGTISSVDGTNNVSGAVTLDNNSVTGKVLTGLTSPSASSVLATDTIVEGFGKLQSQVNGLAGGLRFMGSWDADTNSPVLSSGGGEAANGTTTATTANKLVDSSASFTSTVTVGDQVVNQVDGQTALVSNVDSDTTLSLDADIMLTGEAYTIDNSPFITQGHYYVVSVGGTTTLNGVSNWTVGDWVIAGANNQWTKLDHSQVDGTGTTGNLTKWSSTSVIADSIVSESGSAITVDGSLSTNTNLSSTGNFAVNTDKFTVAAASGIVSTANDIFTAQNKGIFFNGASDFSSGIAGTSAGQGVRIFAGGSAKVTIDSSGNVGINETDPSGYWGQANNIVIDTSGNGGITIKSSTSGNGRLVFTDTKSSTAGNADGGMITYNHTDDEMRFQTNGSQKIVIDSSGNVGIGTTVASSMDAGANNLVVGSGSGTEGMTIYSGTSNSGVIYFADGASGDDRFRGQIGYSHSDNSFNFRTNASSSANMVIDSSGNLGIGTDSPYTNLEVANSGVDSIIRLYAAGGTANIRTWEMRAVGVAGEGLIFRQVNDANNSYTNRMLIDTDGNVGIGTISPDYKLHIKETTTAAKMYINGENGGVTSSLLIGRDARNWEIKTDTAANLYRYSLSYIGTDSPVPNIFTALASGNVGIGTDSAGQKLEVAGRIRVTTDPTIEFYESSLKRGGIQWSLVNDNTNIFAVGGDITFDIGGEKMRITSGGDIQIPTDSAKIQLKSSGSSDYTSIFRDTTNQIVIENTAGTNIFQLDNSGRFTLLGLDGKTQTGSDVRFSTASGELYYNTSSKRYKTDIVNLENSLDKINALRPVRYKDINTGEATCGLIAEETFEIIPDVVFTKEIEGFNEPQIEGLNYSDLIPFLIKSIQELKAEVDSLKKECKCKN